jgi:predicted ATPase/ribulose bisphosphate carboxylase small subunit
MTRRLQALRVGNFKAFADTQRIPLKPITLIFGPNSAGKSSFIHSLALAHEAQFGREKRSLTRLDVHHTDVGGSAIDLGGFRQYVHRGQLNRRVEWGAELKVSALGAGKDQRLAELLAAVETVSLNIALGIELDDQDRPRSGAVPRVDSIEVRGDGVELLRMSSRRADSQGTSLRLDRIDSDHPVFRQVLEAIVENATTSEKMRPEDFEGANEAIALLLPDLLVRVDQFFPTGVDLPKAEGAELSPVSMLVPVSKGNRKEGIAQAVRFYLPRILNDLIKGLADTLVAELKQLQYLGPLRSFPPRHLAFAEHEDSNWYAGGGYAWDQIRRDKVTRDAVNAWLGSPSLLKTPYQIVARRLVPESPTLSDLVEDLVQATLKMGGASSPYAWVSNLIRQFDEFEVGDRHNPSDNLRLVLEQLRGSARQKEAQIAALVKERDLLEREIRSCEDEDVELRTDLEALRSHPEIDLREVQKSLSIKRKDLLESITQLRAQAEELTIRIEGFQEELEKLRRLADENMRAIDTSFRLDEKRRSALLDLRRLLERYKEELRSEENEEITSDSADSLTKHEDGEGIATMIGRYLDSTSIDILQDLKLIDTIKGVEVTHRDVGIGISQVLPVLVMAFGSQGKLLAMEQPEIHLHPALQAELGDVFIESALGERKNTFILETHSEHLILRLMRRIREGKISSDDVGVVYVEPLPQGSRFIELRIDENGDFIDEWPGGFFEESFNEKFAGR